VDHKEFLTLIQNNRAVIHKICQSYCHSPNERDDLAQDIIYHLWKSASSYSPDYKFSTWMYRVALNVAISFYRKNRKTDVTVSLTENPQDMEDHTDETINEVEANRLLLQQFVEELKELDRALMILYLEDKSYAEIAEIMGITETNVATKISRIKDKLKQRFLNHNK
jgi:RNA polymerase sigma factor (sigma-70 family)